MAGFRDWTEWLILSSPIRPKLVNLHALRYHSGRMSFAVLKRTFFEKFYFGKTYMPYVTVKFEYTETGFTLVSSTTRQIQVSKNPPTELEVISAIKKSNPKWKDIVILEIK